MSTALLNKLTGVKDLRKILETTVKDLGETFAASSCQIMLSNPLDPNVTSICQYQASSDPPPVTTTWSMPLALHGLSFGSLALTRAEGVNASELDSLRLVVGELGNIIRQAQISDIVQRDTFRDTFLLEIGNVMSYSLGIGDALFMVVNILGKALAASRCLFICTDDNQSGWKCYEFWQQERIKSCQEFGWPTIDSAVVAQSLLSNAPIAIYEGRGNSYAQPVQEELQLIGVRSLLGVALKSSALEGSGSIHGCVLLQQCDYRRAWTRKEIDMVQSVADKVADALVKLPAEKRAREPIMQLHQRIVAVCEGAVDASSPNALRKAIKIALGQQAIPNARGVKASPGKPIAHTANKVSTPPSNVGTEIKSSAQPQAILKSVFDIQSESNGQASPNVPDAAEAGAVLTKAQLDLAPNPEAPTQAASPEATILIPKSDTSDPSQATISKDAYDVLDLSESVRASKGAKLQAGNEPGAPPSGPGSKEKSAWGNLDAIPTPQAPRALSGLGGTGLHKDKSLASSSGFINKFVKEKGSELESARDAENKFVDGPPLEINEAEAKEKINRLLSAANPTSDYIFATPGLDHRTLGRMAGWLSEIEQKDKYVNGHARQVTEYALDIGQALSLSDDDMRSLRQASLLHDVGKLGTAAQILQKKDEDLTDPELITIMKHPLDGAALLESFPDLKHLAGIVCAHHEEFDGNGYPQGLKGEEIPLLARIIFLSNAYVGLISEMVYGTSMSAEDAQKELQSGVGKQYDPALVKVFLESLAVAK